MDAVVVLSHNSGRQGHIAPGAIEVLLAPANRLRHRLTDMPRLLPSFALSAAAAMFVAAVSPSASAEGQETHGVYHTQFENDSIGLVRVRYPANSKVPLHGHPPTVTTYVYLSGSSPVRFTHQGSRTHVVTRQPTTPGGFRVSRGGDETHSAENLGAIASDFLRVEFKTDAAGASAPFYRDARPLGTTAKTTTDVQFSNAQMRIPRVVIPAGQMTEIATTANPPALLIALGEATMTADGTALPMQIGQERWVASSRRERLANVGASQIELLRIDVLTSAAVLEPAIAQQPAPARSPEAVPTPITLPPALDRVLRDYERAWRDGNGPGLAALFADDGFAVQSGSPLRQGRAAIAKGITRPGGALQLTAYAFSVSDAVGYIVGGYRYPQSTGPGGRFVLALRMGSDGRWLIAADLDNSPAPPPPAAAVVPAPVVPAASAPSASAQQDADTRIALRIGESVTPPKSTTIVTLTEVSDDSRCPTNVTCVWAGDAAVTLRVQPAKGATEVVTLHTGLANGQSATAAGLRLRLERLEPRPTFGKTLDRSAYVATIAIATSAGPR